MPINIHFPFSETTEGGVFGTNKTTQSAIRSNLLAFLTLRKGQRPMNNDFYSPLFDFVFQQFDEISEDELRNELVEKLSAYFPEITLLEVKMNFVEESNLVKITLTYSINDLGGVSDNITVNIPVDEINDGDAQDHL